MGYRLHKVTGGGVPHLCAWVWLAWVMVAFAGEARAVGVEPLVGASTPAVAAVGEEVIVPLDAQWTTNPTPQEELQLRSARHVWTLTALRLTGSDGQSKDTTGSTYRFVQTNPLASAATFRPTLADSGSWEADLKLEISVTDGQNRTVLASGTTTVGGVAARLTGLVVDGATRDGTTSRWWTPVAADSWAVVRAVFDPEAPSNATTLLTWTGGAADSATTRLVAKGTAQAVTVAANGCGGQATATVVVAQVTGLAVESGATVVDALNAATMASSGAAPVVLKATLAPTGHMPPAGVLLWQGGAAVTGRPEARSVPANVAGQTEVVCRYGASAATRVVWVVRLELTVAGVPAEDTQEQPVSVPINNDDDNGSGVPDRQEAEVASEDDLVPVVVRVEPSTYRGPGLALTVGAGFRLWRDPEKREAALPAEQPDADGAVQLWAEAESAATASVAASLDWAAFRAGPLEALVVGTTSAPQRSSGVLRVYRDELLLDEGYDAVGGNAWVVFSLRVEPGSRLEPGASSPSMKVVDADPSHRNDPTAAQLFEMSFTGGRWQQCVSGQWVSASPSGADNRTGQAPMLFRWVWAWDTRREPLGHNGVHLVTVEPQLHCQQWEDGTWSAPYSTGPLPRIVRVANLVVQDLESNRGPDYLIFDPESDDPERQAPKLRFRIRDETPHQYRWTAYLRSTLNADWASAGHAAIVTGTTTVPGLVEVSWRGEVSNGSTTVLPPGPYTWDVAVWECPDAATFAYQPEDTLDQAGAKHPYLLSMAGAFGDNLGFSHDGHYFAADQLPDAAYDADPAVIGRGGYRFQDSRQRAARSVRIDLLDSDFALRATGGEGTADRTVYSDLELHRWSEADIIGTGQWRGVFTAWDNHADRRRDHRSVPMIALNTPGVIPQEQIERAIFCQAVEIIARKQIEKDGWTIFIDPAKGHPFGRGGGPDIGAYRVLPSAGAPRNLEVGVFDQKALGGSSIGVADAPRLTKNGVEAWKQYVRNFLDRDGSGLAAETKVSILSALDDGRLKRTVTDVAGSATALTANAVAEGIELRHVDLTTKEAQRWVKDAVKESKGFMTEFFAKVKRVHDAKPRVARAAKAVLEKFNKLATPIAIACAVVALEQKMARGLSLDSAVSELTDEIGKDLVCYDGLEMLGAQISATAQRMLDRVAKAVLGTRWMRELQKWENPFDVP